MLHGNYRPTGIFRDVAAADLPELERIIEACGLFAPDLLGGMIAPYLAGEADAGWWITLADPMPCAVAYCVPERMTSGTWNLLLLAVHPARQRSGIGAAMMAETELRLAAAGERLLLVETSGLPGFSGTRTFYAAVGYAEEARIRDFYQAGEDKIVFRKCLNRVIRPAASADLERLQAIENDAARLFTTLPEAAFCIDLAPRGVDDHEEARKNGIALVIELNGDACGFLLAVPRDGRAHLLELAVGPRHQRRGLGRLLIDAFEEWAQSRGFKEATLTTFRDVPWNAPAYRRLGYRQLESLSDRPDLAAIIDQERRLGIAAAARVAMCKAL